jgi:hypothetical protein
MVPMKTRLGFVLWMALSMFSLAARAGDLDLTITSEPKHLPDKASSGGAAKQGDEVSKVQQWGYTINLENTTFKPMENLEVKYIIFYSQEKLGQKGPPLKQHKNGSNTVNDLAAGAKASFDTDSVTLTKAALLGPPGGFEYYANGARSKAEDKLTGVWVRVYKDGNVFAEYANPPSLTSREQWQDQ